jgi:hypothetical protein
MIRNLKALGLALVAMGVLGILAASAAQAAPTFSAEASEWHPTGKPLGTHTYTLPFGAELTCEEVHFDPTKTYTSAVASVRATPTYNKCHATIFEVTYPVTVTHNSCEYEFQATKKTAATTYEGTAKVICEKAGVKGIEIHIFQKDDLKHELAPRCTITVKPQTISGILTHNEATDVTLTANTSKVTNTRTSGSLLQCGAENQTAEYHGDTTVTATDSAGNTVKSTIAGE